MTLSCISYGEKMFTKNDTNKVKGMAIILMLIHHCFMNSGRYKGQQVIFSLLPEWRVNEFALSMKICVAMFVFLSAYGITYSLKRLNEKYEYSRKELEICLIKRWTKMMGGFIFIFLLVQLYSVITGQGWYVKNYGEGAMSLLYFGIDMFGLAQFFHTPTFLATFWYMSLAQIIVFIIPLMIMVYRKFGTVTLLALSIMVSMLFPVDTPSNKTYAYLPVYIVCIAVGILASDKNLLVKMKEFSLTNNKFVGKIIKFLVYIILLVAIWYYRKEMLGTTILSVFEGLMTITLIGFMFEFINPIPVVGRVLKFLGVYSMNIFLIHNFIRVCWYYDFTYSFKYPVLIVGVLLVVSLVVAIVIDLIKKLVRWDKLISVLQKKLIGMVSE